MKTIYKIVGKQQKDYLDYLMS